MEMTKLQHLNAILDKTVHIRNGLNAEDMDIVVNALDEREDLIAAFINKNFGGFTGECAPVAAKIMEMNAENERDLKKMMDACNEKVLEARRKIKELQTGKKATNQYHGAVAANYGAAFDFKR
jgi:predicted HicB family RNase H-like nuclease